MTYVGTDRKKSGSEEFSKRNEYPDLMLGEA